MYLLGYRSVPLKNAYSEEYEMTSLLVQFDIRSAKVIIRYLAYELALVFLFCAQKKEGK